MKILGIICSPKKNGNTDVLVERILAGAMQKGAGADKVYINDLTFRPCQDCGYCRRINGCPYDDDMQILYGKIIEADGVVVGAPTYYGNICAQAKMFIDRCFRFNEMIKNDDGSWTFNSRIPGRKKLIFAGTNGSFGADSVPCQRDIIKHLSNDINAEYAAEIFGHYTDEKPVREDGQLLERAGELGSWLYDELKK